MRRTRSGDLLVDLGKGAKSRAAAEPLRCAIVEKLGDHVGSVSKLGSTIEMEVVDLDEVSTPGEVLTAVKDALLQSTAKDDRNAIEAMAEVRISSMWKLRSGQQVAVVKMPRGLYDKTMDHVKVG